MCPENNLTFHCSETDGEVEWIVNDANAREVANYTIENTTGTERFGDNSQFIVQRVNDSFSSLWFRANPAYNSYTVDCVDDDQDVQTCPVQVVGEFIIHLLSVRKRKYNFIKIFIISLLFYQRS